MVFFTHASKLEQNIGDDTRKLKLDKALHGRGMLNRFTLAFVPSLVLLIPVFSFLRHHDYSLWKPEVGLLVLMTCGIGLIPGILATLWPGILGPIVVLIATGIAFDLQSHQFNLVESIIDIGRNPMESVLPLIVVYAAVTVTWLLRKNLGLIAISVAAVILLSTIVLAPRAGVIGVQLDRPVESSSSLPPIIHIVLDEHIGIEGLPADIPGGAALREDLKRSYADLGFRVFGGAFSHLSQTRPSLTALLNGQEVPKANTKTEDLYLGKNAWFENLGNAGYRIRIYQTDWMNYCIEDLPHIEYCRTFSANSIGSLQDTGLSAWAKAQVILVSLSEASSFGVLLRKWAETPKLRVTGINALTMFDSMLDDLKRQPNGTAYFVHFMLPHYSYVLNELCIATPDPRAWYSRFDLGTFGSNRLNTEESRALRYRAYFRQLRCAQRLIVKLATMLSNSDRYQDATIVVHGDHGSRIALTPASEQYASQLTSQDIKDHYSALFAIRAPGLESGYDVTQRSIQALFAEHLLKRPLSPERPEVVLRRKSDHEAGPPQWLPAPDFRD
jgi:hypothetical protein